MTREERETQAARGRGRAQRMNELLRDHAKAELLRMAYPGGLVTTTARRSGADDIASAVVDIGSGAGRPALTT
ncbi:hypothetical protein [Streptomyces griseoluteus]|uniref:hypothetical protein n=1 Tax=Streptomyces griseoluteus TaxID=29306 RepID=UPI0036ABC0C2